jgi:Bacillithiol biosynthesis BshC
MTATCIPYTHVPHSSSLLTDYLYHFDRVKDFYSGSPFEPQSYQAVADLTRSLAVPRREIADILARQNRSFGCPW